MPPLPVASHPGYSGDVLPNTHSTFTWFSGVLVVAPEPGILTRSQNESPNWKVSTLRVRGAGVAEAWGGAKGSKTGAGWEAWLRR